MTDVTSLNQKLTELQVKYDKKVKAYGELRKGYKIVLEHNRVLRDNSEELYKLQLKHEQLKNSFKELLEDYIRFVSSERGRDDEFKEDWYKQAGLL